LVKISSFQLAAFLDQSQATIDAVIYTNTAHKNLNFLTFLGQLCALQTDQHYQKRGYAELVVRRMSQELAKNGLDACALITTGNKPSEKVFQKLGFQKTCIHHFVDIL